MNRWAAENGSNNETPNTIAGSTISLSANVGTITFASARSFPRWRRPPKTRSAIGVATSPSVKTGSSITPGSLRPKS